MRTRKLSRNAQPVTQEDCEQWLASKIVELTKQYNVMLAHVQRCRTAYLIAETIATRYAELPAGSPMTPELLDEVFTAHGVVLPREMLRYVPAMEVIDAGSPFRMAVRIVSGITQISGYKIQAQRQHARFGEAAE